METEQSALEKIRMYVEAGHSLEAIRKVGWSQWMDHLQAKGFDLRTGQLSIRPPASDPPQDLQKTQVSPPLSIAPPAVEPPTGEGGRAFFGRDDYVWTRAGFGRRVGAWLIDYVISAIIASVPGIVLAVIVYVVVLPDFYTPAQEDDAVNTAMAYFSIVYAGVTLLYFWLGNAWGGTFGKRILRLRVLRAASGENLGIWPGLGRYVVWLIGSIPLALGWWWASWDERGQAWHDKAVDSVVVRRDLIANRT